jgi:hypothetical protein
MELIVVVVCRKKNGIKPLLNMAVSMNINEFIGFIVV